MNLKNTVGSSSRTSVPPSASKRRKPTTLSPGKTGNVPMSIAELKRCSTPPLAGNVLVDYAKADHTTRDWLYNGTRPKSPAETKAIAIFCVKQKLPDALSWLVLQCELAELDFAKCELSNQDIRTIAGWLDRCPRQIALNLHGSAMRDHGVKILADALKTNTTLTSLDVSFNAISDTGASALADALKTNATLTRLNVSDNDICASGATVLAEALKTNSTLTSLNLSCNDDIGDAGASALADALKTNSTLISLNVSDNYIGPIGATALADALKTNATLTSLDLSENDIGPIGATALAETLKTNTALTSLDVSENDIGRTGATALAHALKTNSTLTSLNVSDNDIDDSGVIAFADALKANTTLGSLTLGVNELSATSQSALVRIERRLAVNRQAKPLAAPAAEAFQTLPTSWEWKLPLEVGQLIVKEMIVRAPLHGNGVRGLESLADVSAIVKQWERDEKG